jgi:hypothetical protein
METSSLGSSVPTASTDRRNSRISTFAVSIETGPVELDASGRVALSEFDVEQAGMNGSRQSKNTRRTFMNASFEFILL